MFDPLERFLFDTGMHPDCIDLNRETRLLEEQMEADLRGLPSGIKMIPSRLRLPERAPSSGTAAALDAGGTHFRAALVEFYDGGARVSRLDEYPMPGTDGPLDRAGFLSRCAEYVEPVARMSGKIGYVFSYPAEILPNLDGRLKVFQKEVAVTGCEGMEVCASLEEELKRRGMPGSRSYVLVNDTVAALLGNWVRYCGEGFDGAVGLVYGTGTNTCYSGGGEIINMESSGYTLFPKGKFDLELDARSALPGDNLYEKMVSSVYMGELIRMAADAAAQEGVLSRGFGERLRLHGQINAPQADEFIRGRGGPLGELCREADDADRLAEIIKLLYRRAGKLGCAVITAAMTAAAGGKKGLFCLACEGSAYWKSVLYAPELAGFLENYTRSQRGYDHRIVRTDNSNLTGAAAAAASQA